MFDRSHESTRSHAPSVLHTTPAQIMALCRWQTEESLAIYARLGEADYTRLLERCLHADISSVSTANLPVLGAHTALLDLFNGADGAIV